MDTRSRSELAKSSADRDYKLLKTGLGVAAATGAIYGANRLVSEIKDRKRLKKESEGVQKKYE